MSYINDALRKAQKEKKPEYAAHEPMISAPANPAQRPKKRFLTIGILVFVLWLTVAIAFLYRSEENTAAEKHAADVSQDIAAISVVASEAEEAPLEKHTEPVPELPPIAPPAVKAQPEKITPQALYEKALKKQQDGRLQEAKELYKDVIKVDPRNIQALNNLGVVYMDLNVYKWAIIRLNDALKIRYDYPKAHYNLACVYARQNNSERSLFYLKNAIEFNPDARTWAKNDKDFQFFSDLPEFKKLLEKK